MCGQGEEFCIASSMSIRSQLRCLCPPFLRKRIRRFLHTFRRELEFLRKRKLGYVFLKGEGLEIGAFEHSAPLPKRCKTYYVDAISREQAVELFPEIDPGILIAPDYLIDVNQDGLAKFPDDKWDYVIACHVIEHLANPGRFVGELFRVVRPGGYVVIAAPDKRYTFDRTRPQTELGTLYEFFCNGRSVTPEDYKDISRFVNTADLELGPAEQKARLDCYYQRREHLSVWTSDNFRTFMASALAWNKVQALPVYEVDGEKSRFEYFGVWRKL